MSSKRISKGNKLFLVVYVIFATKFVTIRSFQKEFSMPSILKMRIPCWLTFEDALNKDHTNISSPFNSHSTNVLEVVNILLGNGSFRAFRSILKELRNEHFNIF